MRRRGEHGFTIVEVLIASAMTVFMSVLIIQAMRSLSSTQAYSEGQSSTTTMAERLVQRVVRDAQFALRLVPENAKSRGFLDAMNLGEITPAPDSRLPVASHLGYFEPDPVGENQTGNMLFMARALPAFVAPLASDPMVSVRVDLLRFVIYFTSVDGGNIDLNRWGSVPIARFQDLDAIDLPGDRTATGMALRAEGVGYAWDTEKPLASAFYRIADDGSLIQLTGSFQISAESAQTEAGILSARRTQIAPNGALNAVHVPAYAHEAPGFPNGFEVKIDGAGAGSLLLVRLVLLELRLSQLTQMLKICFTQLLTKRF